MGTNGNKIKGTPAEAVAREKAKNSAKLAMENLSESVLFTIGVTASNIRNGAFWGFTKMRDVQAYADELRADKNIILRKIGKDDVIVEVLPQYIVQNIVSVAPDVFSQSDLDEMSRSMSMGVVEFEKFLLNKGIMNEGFGSTIGIYCVNKVTSIVYKGTSYPAFRISMEKALSALNQCGYLINVGGNFIPPSQAAQSGEALWQSVHMSETKTGVFINVKSTYPPEKLKGIKKQLDAQYKGV